MPGLSPSTPTLFSILLRHFLLVLGALLSLVLLENDFGSLELGLDSLASLLIDLNPPHLGLEPLVYSELPPEQLLLAEQVAFFSFVLVIVLDLDVVLLFPLLVEIFLVRRRDQSSTFCSDHLLLRVVAVVFANEAFLLAVPLHTIFLLLDVVGVLADQIEDFTLCLSREVLLQIETFLEMVIRRHVRNVEFVVFKVFDVFHFPLLGDRSVS